jgi:hypothetical protein
METDRPRIYSESGNKLVDPQFAFVEDLFMKDKQ